MNIKKLFRDQSDGFKDLVKGLSYDQVTFTTFIISWIALLCIMIVSDGIIIGFVKTVLISTVVCALAHNISSFFKK